MNKIIERIEKKIGVFEIARQIVNNISNSELNSFLLHVFNLKSREISAPEVLNNFQNNRFTAIPDINPILYREVEIMWLKSARQLGFHPIQLSPLTPFGTCSAVASVDQNNIVSSLRGTEIVSDATNVLALKIARELKKSNTKSPIKYCTSHRHVRAQYYTNPLFSAHFGLFCMASGGYDIGGYDFEAGNLKEHIKFYITELSKVFDKDDLLIIIEFKEENEIFNNKVKLYLDKINEVKIKYVDNEKSYYNLLRFKVFIKYKDDEIDIVDGGFVDWTQKLLENKKQRLIISCSNIEFIHKFTYPK